MEAMPQIFFLQLFTKQSGVTMRPHTNYLCHSKKQFLSTTDGGAHHRPDTSRCVDASVGDSVYIRICLWQLSDKNHIDQQHTELTIHFKHSKFQNSLFILLS